MQFDVLLVTATEIEARTVLSLFQRATGHTYKRYNTGPKTYFDLGTLGGARICMVQSEMGAGGPAGALLTVHESIQELSPSAIIMVGIAFGMNQQQIGDILVSRQLLGYEYQRVSSDNAGQVKITLRGDRPQASARLLDRFRSGVLDWKGPRVHFGLILSGDKLIDNKHFLDQLLQHEPEAIGGEMEGIGLYAAAQRNKVDWIVVKAISDWADGSKEQNKEALQQQAAENAVRFTMHVLQQGGFRADGVDNAQPGAAQFQAPPKAPGKGTAVAAALGTKLRTYDVHASWVVAVAWEPEGNRIASAGGDGTVRVWDAETGHTLITYRGHSWALAKINMQPIIYNIAWSPQGLLIASAGDGTKVFVWNAATGQTLLTYQGHSGLLPNVFAIDWSPDGRSIASACSSIGFDKTVHVWDIATARTSLRYASRYGLTPNFSVLALKWSPDGTRIASTSGDKTIRIWNAASGKPISTYSAEWASEIAWSPDSTLLAMANSDHTAQIWDVTTGQIIRTYSGHTESVRDVAWSPDGTRIASASNDRTVQIWQAR